MLGHLSLGVADLDRTAAFYDATMGALGWVQVWRFDDAIGYGEPGGPDRLALFLRPNAERPLAAGPGFHLALHAESQPVVDAFYAAAMAHAGTCEGPPGLRPHYGATYYACFVRDPDGHKLEAKHS